MSNEFLNHGSLAPNNGVALINSIQQLMIVRCIQIATCLHTFQSPFHVNLTKLEVGQSQPFVYGPDRWLRSLGRCGCLWLVSVSFNEPPNGHVSSFMNLFYRLGLITYAPMLRPPSGAVVNVYFTISTHSFSYPCPKAKDLSLNFLVSSYIVGQLWLDLCPIGEFIRYFIIRRTLWISFENYYSVRTK